MGTDQAVQLRDSVDVKKLDNLIRPYDFRGAIMSAVVDELFDILRQNKDQATPSARLLYLQGVHDALEGLSDLGLIPEDHNYKHLTDFQIERSWQTLHDIPLSLLKDLMDYTLDFCIKNQLAEEKDGSGDVGLSWIAHARTDIEAIRDLIKPAFR